MIRSMPLRYRSFVLLLLPVCGPVHIASAQQFQHIQAYRDQSAPGSKFGWSIATTEQRLIVGSPHAESQAGVVSAFAVEELAWTTVSGSVLAEGNVLAPQDQRFGAVVATSGDHVAVGNCSTYGTDQYCNDAAQWVSIYRIVGGSWQYTGSIPAPAGAAGNFGKALAMSADHVAVGGSRLSVAGVVQDVVLLYARDGDNWLFTPQDTLVGFAATAMGNGAFGHSLAMRASLLLVGCSGDDDLGTDCGAAYVFGMDQGGSGNWGLLRKMLPSDGVAGDRFGFSVALTNERAVIGAPLRANGTDAVGSAYVFHRDAGATNNWGEVSRMTPSDPHANMQFGASVALNDERIAVGAPFDMFSENGTDGSVEVFIPQDDTWTFSQRIVPYQDGHVSQVSRSGTSLAFARDKLLIGAPFAIVDSSTTTPTGAVLVYGDPELGMEEIAASDYNIYPNPCDGGVTVEALGTGPAQLLALELFDVSGARPTERMMAQRNGRIYFQMADLAVGVYVMKISDATSGAELVRRALVVAR